MNRTSRRPDPSASSEYWLANVLRRNAQTQPRASRRAASYAAADRQLLEEVSALEHRYGLEFAGCAKSADRYNVRTPDFQAVNRLVLEKLRDVLRIKAPMSTAERANCHDALQLMRLLIAVMRGRSTPAAADRWRRHTARSRVRGIRYRQVVLSHSRTKARSRGAGRPGHRTVRSCARSGDSGDDGPGSSPPAPNASASLLSSQRGAA